MDVREQKNTSGHETKDKDEQLSTSDHQLVDKQAEVYRQEKIKAMRTL